MRPLRFLLNTIFYGTGYAVLNHLIDEPKPLDEEKVWKFVAGSESGFRRWIREAWPPSCLRRLIFCAGSNFKTRRSAFKNTTTCRTSSTNSFSTRSLCSTPRDHIRGDETLIEGRRTKRITSCGSWIRSRAKKSRSSGAVGRLMLRHIEGHTW